MEGIFNKRNYSIVASVKDGTTVKRVVWKGKELRKDVDPNNILPEDKSFLGTDLVVLDNKGSLVEDKGESSPGGETLGSLRKKLK